MKSEAAGDKVTVPMTEQHIAALGHVLREFSTVGATTHERNTVLPAIREILVLVRSQVESGMTGRVNPETHCPVPLVDIRELRNALTDFGSLLYGWHMDGTAWSEWDESVRQRLLHINTTFLWLATPATQEDR